MTNYCRQAGALQPFGRLPPFEIDFVRTITPGEAKILLVLGALVRDRWRGSVDVGGRDLARLAGLSFSRAKTLRRGLARFSRLIQVDDGPRRRGRWISKAPTVLLFYPKQRFAAVPVRILADARHLAGCAPLVYLALVLHGESRYRRPVEEPIPVLAGIVGRHPSRVREALAGLRQRGMITGERGSYLVSFERPDYETPPGGDAAGERPDEVTPCAPIRRPYRKQEQTTEEATDERPDYETPPDPGGRRSKRTPPASPTERSVSASGGGDEKGAPAAGERRRAAG